jgi:hypothetical protein
MKDALKKPKTPSGSRSFSTSVRRRLETSRASEGNTPSDVIVSAGETAISTPIPNSAAQSELLKAPHPTWLIKHHSKRYHIVEHLFTNLLMRHGQKASAQRVSRRHCVEVTIGLKFNRICPSFYLTYVLHLLQK